MTLEVSRSDRGASRLDTTAVVTAGWVDVVLVAGAFAEEACHWLVEGAVEGSCHHFEREEARSAHNPAVRSQGKIEKVGSRGQSLEEGSQEMPEEAEGTLSNGQYSRGRGCRDIQLLFKGGGGK